MVLAGHSKAEIVSALKAAFANKQLPDLESGTQGSLKVSHPPKPDSTVKGKERYCGDHKSHKISQGRVARGLRSETENMMSNSISTLLLRNLSDVFGENDPVRRRAAIDEIFHEDAVFYDPKGGIFRGRDEIDRIAGVIKATHPDFEYQPLFPPEELGDAGRVRWVSGTPGKPPAYAGTDFIVARNGRIASVYLFFDNLP
jgi:hypothetical protein